MHRNSELMFAKHCRPHFRADSRVLEIGPDSVPSTYCRIVGDRSIRWETLDIHAREGLTHRAPGEYEFPIADGTYDVVVSGQVLEHVRRIWTWIREVARVTKPGGLVLTISPVTWPYHEAPVDCWRVYPEGMRALYEEGGLDVLHVGWGSLEPRSWLPRFPRSPDETRCSVPFKLARWLRYPLARAFDTVAIGRKRS